MVVAAPEPMVFGGGIFKSATPSTFKGDRGGAAEVSCFEADLQWVRGSEMEC